MSLKAFTLVEVLVSLFIVGLAIGAPLSFISTISKKNNQEYKNHQARLLIEEALAHIKDLRNSATENSITGIPTSGRYDPSTNTFDAYTLSEATILNQAIGCPVNNDDDIKIYMANTAQGSADVRSVTVCASWREKTEDDVYENKSYVVRTVIFKNKIYI
ncbi:MAG: type II secretion system protein [Alphaproteobacteria bacterium]|nr:type II secretion system protein [Alphaproteobacteria bacterium]